MQLWQLRGPTMGHLQAGEPGMLVVQAQSKSRGLSIRQAKDMSLSLRPKSLSSSKGVTGMLRESQGQQLTFKTGVEHVPKSPSHLVSADPQPIGSYHPVHSDSYANLIWKHPLRHTQIRLFQVSRYSFTQSSGHHKINHYKATPYQLNADTHLLKWYLIST